MLDINEKDQPIEFWFGELLCSCGEEDFTHDHECNCCQTHLSHDSNFARNREGIVSWCEETAEMIFVSSDEGIEVDDQGDKIVCTNEDKEEWSFKIRKVTLE